MNLHDLFSIPPSRSPDKVAIEFAQDGQTERLTYRELYAAVDKLAADLQAWGLQKGDRVAFFLGNRTEFISSYLAVIKLGAVMLPINLRYRKVELTHILSDATPRLLITELGQQTTLDEIAEATAGLEGVLYVDDIASTGEIARLGDWIPGDPTRHPPPATRHPPLIHSDDLALIMYTSGTTGRSKGAMITHNNVMATVTGLLSAWAWTPTDRLLLCLPLFHTHGLVVGLHCALAAGATILLRGQFDAKTTTEEILGTIPSGAPTLFFGVPTLYVRLVEELRSRVMSDELGVMSERAGAVVAVANNSPLATRHSPLSHMRLFCSGSAPLAAETMIEFEQLTGHAILERYGMTETGMNLSNPYLGARIPGSVGTPLPGVSMRIIKPSKDAQARNEDVALGEEGELLVRGGNVFIGYWNAPEKTLASFSHDAEGRQWFHTGDLARQDPETGYVTLLGRSHELIISGGFNIYPREIEEMLLTFPGISEAAVVGMAHAEWGEVPMAYLVCNTPIDEASLIAYCRKQLASFKVPKKIVYAQELPRNAMGKLQKNLLPR